MTAASTFRIGGDLEVRRLGFGAMHLRPETAEERAAASRSPGGPSNSASH